MTSPPGSRMGAPLSAMGRRVPSRATSRRWLESATGAPWSSTRATGSPAGPPLSADSTRNTSPSMRPVAAAALQPVRASATGFMRVTRPPPSVAMTASPMELSVTASRCRSRSSSSVARRRPITSWKTAAISPGAVWKASTS